MIDSLNIKLVAENPICDAKRGRALRIGHDAVYFKIDDFRFDIPYVVIKHGFIKNSLYRPWWKNYLARVNQVAEKCGKTTHEKRHQRLLV